MSSILFLSHSRRGLGHLMRGLNIARAIAARDPGADLRFFARSASAVAICGERFPCVADESDRWQESWAALARRLAPDAVVYDTLLPAEAPPRAGRTVYVMRRCKEDRQRAIFASPFLAGVDRIIIPHTPEEFGYDLPAGLAGRASFVGPIVRPPDPAAYAGLRRRYGLADDEAPLVSTVGGGGFDAASFFAVAAEAHRQAIARRPGLRHIVVRGPNYAGELPALAGMTVVEHEPDLASLFGIAGLVIAEGGYNSVNEIRLAGAPAAFLPGERSYDDQGERVAALERLGAAVVFAERDPARAAPQIAALAASPALLRRMRAAHAAAPLTTGNAAAAAIVLGVAQ